MTRLRRPDVRPGGLPIPAPSLIGARVRDLGFVRTLPHLRALWLSFTPADDLSLLAETQLTELHLAKSPARDLSPLVGLPLTTIAVLQNGEIDLRPLERLPLTSLRITNPAAHADRLWPIATLKTINDKPVAEVLPDGP